MSVSLGCLHLIILTLSKKTPSLFDIYDDQEQPSGALGGSQ